MNLSYFGGLKGIFKTYFVIYFSLGVTGVGFFIYMIYSGFQGDVGPYNTLLLFCIGAVITALISSLLFFIIYGLFGVIDQVIYKYLFLGLVLIGLIQMIIWIYGNNLFEKGLLDQHLLFSFGFYSSEELLFLMHSIFYLITGIYIHYMVKK